MIFEVPSNTNHSMALGDLCSAVQCESKAYQRMKVLLNTEIFSSLFRVGKNEIFQSEVVVESLSPEGKVLECLLAATQYNTWRGKANRNRL